MIRPQLLIPNFSDRLSIIINFYQLSNDSDDEQAWKEALIRERRLVGPGACGTAAKLLARNLALCFSTSSVERLLLGKISQHSKLEITQ